MVGVNEYRIEEEIKIKPLKYDPKAEKKVVMGLKQFKKERSGAGLKKALDGVKRAAERNENMVQPTFEAVKAYATVGEISDALRAVHGEFIEGKSYF